MIEMMVVLEQSGELKRPCGTKGNGKAEDKDKFMWCYGRYIYKYWSIAIDILDLLGLLQ